MIIWALCFHHIHWMLFVPVCELDHCKCGWIPCSGGAKASVIYMNKGQTKEFSPVHFLCNQDLAQDPRWSRSKWYSDSLGQGWCVNMYCYLLWSQTAHNDLKRKMCFHRWDWECEMWSAGRTLFDHSCSLIDGASCCCQCGFSLSGSVPLHFGSELNYLKLLAQKIALKRILKILTGCHGSDLSITR